MENQLEGALKSGGSTDFGLDIEKVVNARLIELNSLSKEIKLKDNKLVLQRIPRYMRRRAASHNPKRVPSRYVKHPLAALANSAVKERRRKKRKKHVNKAKQRLSVRKRNKKEGRTLLHIWFRKRFSLVNELDYLVPLKNNTKNYRNLHRVSTRTCAFYYRPLSRSLEIKFADRQQLSEAMVLLKGLFNCPTRLNDCADRELDLFFYKDNRCLAPVSVLQHSETSIWLSIPADFHSSLNQKLSKLFSGINLKFTVYENQFERFRLVGPKSSKYLELLLNNSSSKAPDDVRLAGLLSGEPPNKAFRVVESSKFTGPKSSESVTILVKDKQRRILDALVPRRFAKRFWYNLVKNKSHLVGGKVDQEYFALQNDLVSYPSIGFLDLPVHKDSSKFKLLKAVLELKSFGEHQTSDEIGCQSDEISSTRDHPQVLRLPGFLGLCESPIENADAIGQLYSSSTIDQQSFVNVKLQAVKKGAIDENDLIYLPSAEDLVALQRTAKLSKEERFASELASDEAPVERMPLKRLDIAESTDSAALAFALKQSSRPVIGVVEIGGFSLKSGKSEAFGTVCTGHLVELIGRSRRCSLDSLYVLTRSRGSAKFRFSSIAVRNFQLF